VAWERKEGTVVRKLITTVVLSLTVLLVSGSIPSSPAKADNERGRKLFVQYCASCHGVDGKGQGPVAPTLRKPVPDLTQIAKKEGKFPGGRVSLVIGGEVGQTEVAAHGTREMPVWGKVFRSKRGDYGVGLLDVSVLTRYIESIQQR
jgi:mono/diheme cytochrome c family protein